MLGQRHFFKPRPYVKVGNILGRHLVVEDKDHGNQPFDNRRIAIAAQRQPSVFALFYHDPHLALAALNDVLRGMLFGAQRRQPLAEFDNIEVLLFPVRATTKVAQQFVFIR